MTHPLRKPYREKGTTKNKLISILVFGLFIFLFLYLFKPFGMSQLKPLQQLFVSIGFGLITSFILIIYNLIFNQIVINEKWNTGKHILTDILKACRIATEHYN